MIQLLFLLIASVSYEDQADIMLSYIPFPNPTHMSYYALGLDDSRNLWILGRWYGGYDGLYLSKINRSGEVVLDMIPVAEPTEEFPHVDIAAFKVKFDRWDNAYTMFKVSDSRDMTNQLHLARVDSKGNIQDFYPWPGLKHSSHYLEFLDNDTMFLYGIDEDYYNPKSLKIMKALVSKEGIEPLPDEERSYHHKLSSGAKNPLINLSVANGRSDLMTSVVNWETGFCIFTRNFNQDQNIEPNPLLGVRRVPEWSPDKLHIHRFNINPVGDEIEEQVINIYDWRDYVWRTYNDFRVGWMTIEPHKDGGYMVCTPDPADMSVTHLIRLDEDGVPIDPSELEDGGVLTVRDIKKINSSEDVEVDLEKWSTLQFIPSLRHSNYVTDSAQVTFWGLDDNGDLYGYKKLRRY